MINLTISGDPIPAGRPRFTRQGHAYQPKFGECKGLRNFAHTPCLFNQLTDSLQNIAMICKRRISGVGTKASSAVNGDATADDRRIVGSHKSLSKIQPDFAPIWGL